MQICAQSSSWLRDALSELDPSCEKITFIGNPAADVVRNAGQQGGSAGGTASTSKPLFRIKASGDFGSTEVCVTFIISRCYSSFIRGDSEGKRGINFDLGFYRWITRTIRRYWRPLNVCGL